MIAKVQRYFKDIRDRDVMLILIGILIGAVGASVNIHFRGRRREKQELIRKMGSIVREVAVPAAEELRAHGWLKDGSLKGVNLFLANLQGAPLHGANLQEVYLEGTNLQGASLSGVNLQGAYMVGTNLQGASLSRASLQGAFLLSANLQGAHLYRVNLQGATLSVVNLQGADLSEANLQGADLSYANLQETDLREASLQGTNLHAANLQGADLQETVFDDSTTLPDGTQWTPDTDLTRFTDPAHPDFWRSDHPLSPAYRGRTKEAPEA